MSAIRPRLGLSFEVAPPAAVHPLRTDVACFVGTVARRSRRADDRAAPMPVVLARWLQSHRIDRVGGVPVGQLRVALASPGGFFDTVLEQASDLVPEAGGSSERDTLAGFFDAETGSSAAAPKFARLLDACHRLAPLSAALVDDLGRRGFAPRALLGTDELAAWWRVQCLHNLPVAVEGFEAFDALFGWDRRGIRERRVEEGDPVLATPLGVAVRAFFGEGGRRAWVVRSGDPSALFDGAAGAFAACFPEGAAASEPTPFDGEVDRCPQLPGIRRQLQDGALDRVTVAFRQPALSAGDWVGLEHVYGLADVSFVLLPDLVDACALPVPAEIPPDDVVAAPERFVDCVETAPPEQLPVGRRLPLPAHDARGLEIWRRLQVQALDLLGNPGRALHRRDVQLLASLPLLAGSGDLPAPAQWLSWMAATPGWLAPSGRGDDGLLSDRLQLAWPWLRTGDSDDARGGVEAPEGTLAGVLARSALERGSYRSAATQPVRRHRDSVPVVSWTQATQQAIWTPLGSLTLAERICLLGPSPRGARLLSDVSCSADARTRQAAVRRLVNVVVRAARDAGDEFAFDGNGEALWARVRARLADLMRVLLAAGALSSDGVPFSVRCGRDTMRQNDIDAGRLIAEIELQPAQPIQRIVVVLDLRDAGAAAALAEAA